MTQPVSAIAVFCEDIREEKSRQDIIIGVFPDNLNLQTSVAASATTEKAMTLLPKLSVYVRVNFDAKDKVPRAVGVKILDAVGVEVTSTAWERPVIEKAFADAKASKSPIVGLLAKIVGGPFPIRQSGRVLAKVTIDRKEYVAGMLNLTLPSASVPPASQSASGVLATSSPP